MSQKVTKLEGGIATGEVMQTVYAAPSPRLEPISGELIQTVYAPPGAFPEPLNPGLVQTVYAAPTIEPLIDEPIQVVYAPPSPTPGTPIQVMYAPPSPEPFEPGRPLPVVYAPPSPTPGEPIQVMYAPPSPDPFEPGRPLPVVYAPPSPAPGDINITYEEIENNIKVINKSVTTMRDDWNSIVNETLVKIGHSWAGDDCESYINKIKEMKTKMENSFEALELLSTTYEKAKELVADSQKSVKSYIDSL